MLRRIFLILIAGCAATLAGFASLGVVACGAVETAPVVSSGETREELAPSTTLEIQYIANEGVLITSRDKRVLIDGLHRKYLDDYAFLPEVERIKIETAKSPFDKIDLVLVSHYHGDHFHPESAGLYLKHNPNARFASSQQVVDEVAGKFGEYLAIKDRVTPVSYTLKSRQPMKIAGVDVEFLGVGHGTGRHAAIQNLGHVITLAGKKVLHIGDADTSDGIFDAFDLEKQGIDIALLPYWLLTSKSGQAIIEKHIRPKQIIAVHVGPGEADDIERLVKQSFPKADIFKTMLEKRNF